MTSLVPLTPQKHVPPSNSQRPSFLLFLPNISAKLDSIWYLQLLLLPHLPPLPSPSSSFLPFSSPTSSPPTFLPHLWILSSSAQLEPWKFLNSKRARSLPSSKTTPSSTSCWPHCPSGTLKNLELRIYQPLYFGKRNNKGPETLARLSFRVLT